MPNGSPLAPISPPFPQSRSSKSLADSLATTESVVFLLDLSAIPLHSIYELKKEVFESPDILKLGFRCKQDLVYVSSTFVSQGCDPGFDRVEPFLDITSIYSSLQNKLTGRKIPKQTKSLATICKDVLGVYLSKELQCSDWSCRPLTEEQMQYAAADAHCLLKIFDIFQCKFLKEGNAFYNDSEFRTGNLDLGLKLIFEKPGSCNKLVRANFCKALEMVQSTTTELPQRITAMEDVKLSKSSWDSTTMDDTLLQIVRRYGDKTELKELDRKPKASKKKEKRQASVGLKKKNWICCLSLCLLC